MYFVRSFIRSFIVSLDRWFTLIIYVRLNGFCFWILMSVSDAMAKFYFFALLWFGLRCFSFASVLHKSIQRRLRKNVNFISNILRQLVEFTLIDFFVVLSVILCAKWISSKCASRSGSHAYVCVCVCVRV